jgi:hypothetical protein
VEAVEPVVPVQMPLGLSARLPMVSPGVPVVPVEPVEAVEPVVPVAPVQMPLGLSARLPMGSPVWIFYLLPGEALTSGPGLTASKPPIKLLLQHVHQLAHPGTSQSSYYSLKSINILSIQ